MQHRILVALLVFFFNILAAGTDSSLLKELKESCLKHDQLTDIHEWICYICSNCPSDTNPRLCRLSLFPFAPSRVYTITDITDNISSMSVASAEQILITPDVIQQRECRVDLCTILRDTPSTVVLLSDNLLHKIIGLQFDSEHTLFIDAASLVDRLKLHVAIRSHNISHVPSVNPIPKSVPLLQHAVSEMKMETTSPANSISYLRTATVARLDQLSVTAHLAFQDSYATRTAVDDINLRRGQQ